ncbi:hypothetical protein [Luteimonas flava]|uniref:hypothetical protein n=1 Tax=Luteimonas flava TaxID=3115822 RepID=UPI002F960FAF
MDLIHVASPSQLRLAKLKRDAASLAKANHCESLELRAHIALVEGNLEEADRLYSLALASTDDLTGTIVRYAMTLVVGGHCYRAKEILDAHPQFYRGQPAAVHVIQQLLTCGGWFSSAADLDVELLRMRQETLDCPGFNEIPDGIQPTDFVDAVQFARRELKQICDLARAFRVTGVDVEKDQPTILYEMAVSGDYDEIAAIEWELLTKINEQSFEVVQRGLLSFALMHTDAIKDAD